MRRADHTGRLGTTPPVPGRPSLSLTLLAVCAGLVLAALTWQVATVGPLLAPDERLGDAVRTSDALPSGAARFLADLGDLGVALPVLAATLAYVTWRTRNRRVLAVAVLTMALVPALVGPLQSLLARPGPPPMAPATGFFPSGHAATAAVAYGLCALLLGGRAAVLACLALNLAVGAGLVRMGYHWPADVLGSWCLSWLLLYGAAAASAEVSSPAPPSGSTLRAP
ncbi:phosphatase PAP2 family protein [Streptomyces beihaiensis]|uniref:phosphatase PAP2 family protein n=1 Tax=Streptomyces beihaiensis TaxID=2984495 RepID=UPI002B1CCF17|nr:phosphatase PAP2 family protein [Streptomyces beihaiensis]